MGVRCNPYEGLGPQHFSEDEVREITIKHKKNSHKKNKQITALKAEVERLRERNEMLSTPNTKEWLKTRGYDGLYTDDCGCFLDDLGPCGEGVLSCYPGYRQHDNTVGPKIALQGKEVRDERNG